MIVGCDCLIALGSEDYDFVTSFDMGNVGYIENCVVHADAAHERGTLAADEETE